MHRSAQTPERLLAARMLQEDPRAAWRQLQSVVLLAFVAVTVGAGLTVIGAADGEPGVEHLVEDMRTGALVTVLYGFFAAACAVLIDQAAAADDRWQVWFGLHRLGMPVAQIDRARRLAVMRPLRVLLVIAVGATVIVLSPMIGAGALISPMTLAAVVVVLGAGVAMIPMALRATRPALRRRAEGGPAGL